MTAAARILPAARPSALAVFIARAEARAQLWHVGELDLHDAVDELWHAAERDGLVAQLGADKAQEILADAFAPARDDLPECRDAVPDELPEPAARGVAASTLKAAEFLVREGDAERFRNWLDRRSASERQAILRHLEQRKGTRAQ